MNDANQSGFAAEMRDSVHRLVSQRLDLKRRRSLRETLPGHDPELFAEILALGCSGILVPEADGGLGLGFAEMAAVFEELERGLLGEPLLGMMPAIRCLVHAPGGARRSELLAGIATGDILPALALGHDASVAADAQADGAVTRLSGVCQSVPGAEIATGFVVPARVGQRLSLFWIERHTAGLSIETEWRADGTPLGRLRLDGVALGADASLSQAADATSILARALDESRVLASAALVGLMRHVLSLTLDYMRVRVQYDRAIGSYQALQHKAVDLHIQQELAISVLVEATRSFDDGDDETVSTVAAVRAKARCSDAGLRITREAVHLHGALGITDEFDIGLYLKRSLVLASWLGNGAVQRRRFMELSGGSSDDQPVHGDR